MAHQIHAVRNQVAEWSYTSTQRRDDPFNELELDIVVRHADGDSWRIPAYWAGGQEWRARFAPPKAGVYEIISECSDESDGGLHGVQHALQVAEGQSERPLLAHGGLRVAPSGRSLEHRDGTPFFWLADTWWMGFCQRLAWPEDFQRLTADRVAKGFTVIQIVAGLYPDMPSFDPRGANEAGYPWEADHARINPAYFDMADLRVQWLVRSGLVPCIVACWGYYLPWLGMAKMKQHWRNLVARWSAYPVVWCLAGEAAMPYYLSEDKEGDKQRQTEGWTELARYVHGIDPMQRPVTIHPTSVGRDQVADPGVLDFDMLQTGHGGYESIPNTVKLITDGVGRSPAMPVLNGEVNYEGFLHGNYDEVQRMAFWSCMLSGAAGHTYGANGIWQVNTKEKPYGPSPHGNTWGNLPWDEAMALPGSAQLGVGKRILLACGWPDLEPHQEWIEPAANEGDRWSPYAAGVPRQIRVIYSYRIVWGRSLRVKGIEPDVTYRARFINPSTGEEHALGPVEAESDGAWLVPQQPELRDWVLVLEAS